MRDRDNRNPVSSNAFGSGKSKLCASTVKEIRSIKGLKSSRDLAPIYGVSSGTILRIWRGLYLCKEGDYV